MNANFAQTVLIKEFPAFAMEIQEYLSFAEIENFTAEQLIKDFVAYLDN